jgi:hypothetical protein
VEDVDAQESAGEPKAGRDEAEGLSSLPLPTVAATCETAPVERAAAVDLVNPVDERAKRGKPGETKKEVERIMEEVEGEWQKPDQAEEGRDSSDNLSVDFASERTIVTIVMVLVDEVADDAEHNNSTNQLVLLVE